MTASFEREGKLVTLHTAFAVLLIVGDHSSSEDGAQPVNDCLSHQPIAIDRYRYNVVFFVEQMCVQALHRKGDRQ